MLTFETTIIYHKKYGTGGTTRIAVKVLHLRHDDYHRLDGPAYISSLERAWMQYGDYHRVDGPARTIKEWDDIYMIRGVIRENKRSF